MSVFKRIFRVSRNLSQLEKKGASSDVEMPDEALLVRQFEKKIGLQFSDHSLLVTALKHRSFLNVTNEPRIYSNERLEFLGDAVLDLVVTHFLYKKFPRKTEGQLSKVKSILVSKPVLAEIAVKISLGEMVLINWGEEKTGGRQRQSILADALEAVIGAIYLDKGLDKVTEFIHAHLLQNYHKIVRKSLYKNYKSILLEYAQSSGKSMPEYRVIGELGPDHEKEFIIQVWVDGENLGEGKGRSKKIAEQKAAEQAVRKLDLQEKSI